MSDTTPPPLLLAAYHECGHAAYIGLTGIGNVYEITVDTDRTDQEPDGEVQQKKVRDATEDETAICYLAGPLAELKCIANYGSEQEWNFDLNVEIQGFFQKQDTIAAAFVAQTGEKKVITTASAPFETDLNPVREKYADKDAVMHRARLTQQWLNEPEYWSVVKKLAVKLIELKGKHVLRRQLFGYEIAGLMKADQK